MYRLKNSADTNYRTQFHYCPLARRLFVDIIQAPGSFFLQPPQKSMSYQLLKNLSFLFAGSQLIIEQKRLSIPEFHSFGSVRTWSKQYWIGGQAPV